MKLWTDLFDCRNPIFWFSKVGLLIGNSIEAFGLSWGLGLGLNSHGSDNVVHMILLERKKRCIHQEAKCYWMNHGFKLQGRENFTFCLEVDHSWDAHCIGARHILEEDMLVDRAAWDTNIKLLDCRIQALLLLDIWREVMTDKFEPRRTWCELEAMHGGKELENATL